MQKNKQNNQKKSIQSKKITPQNTKTQQVNSLFQRNKKDLNVQTSKHTSFQSISNQEFQKQQHDNKWEEFIIMNEKISQRSYTQGSIHNNKLYIYGGYEYSTGVLSDFYYVDLNPEYQHLWQKVRCQSQLQPGPRCRHGCWVHQNNFYIFGGVINNTKSTNSLMSYNFKSQQWQNEESQNTPQPIDSFQTIYDNVDNRVFIIGGYLQELGQYSNGIYILNLDNMEWETLFEPTQNIKRDMEGRTNLSAIYSFQKDKIYCFGGYNGYDRLNDLWNFDLYTKKWGQITPKSELQPCQRSGAAMQLYKNFLVLFGGIFQVTQELDDLYIFDLDKNIWIEIDQNTMTKNVNQKQEKMIKKSNNQSPSKSPVRNSTKERQSTILNLKKGINLVDGNNIGTSPTKRKQDVSSFIQEEVQNNSPMLKNLQIMQSPHTNDYFQYNIPDSPNKHQSEKKCKQFIKDKVQMLQTFQLDEKEYNSTKETLNISPRTLEMQFKLDIIGNPDPKIKVKNNTLTDFGRKTYSKFQQPLISDFHTKIGRKPCARDGAFSILNGNKMVIFGGDRHQMSFNDLFYLNLEKLFDSNKN